MRSVAMKSSPCEAALSTAIDHGMRVAIPMVLMSTNDFGNWTLYLPRTCGTQTCSSAPKPRRSGPQR
jgi:hypothetical protein